MNHPLFQVICRTGIFMICAQAIVQFRPQESYEKYLKLLVSVMILVQLFLPIGRLFTGLGITEAETMLASFREDLEQGMEEAKRQAMETDALLEQMTLEEVRRRMAEQEAGAERKKDVKESAKEVDEEAAKAEDAEEAAKEEGEGAFSEAGSEPAEGRITVEMEPIEPIFGGQTGGTRGDGEQVE